MKNLKLLPFIAISCALVLAGCVTERQVHSKSSQATTQQIDESTEQDESQESKPGEESEGEEDTSEEQPGETSEEISQSIDEDTSEEGKTSEFEPQSSGWFVVGKGAFLSGGAEWSIEGGIELILQESSLDPNANMEAKATITFAAGDVWKITNGSIWVQMNCVESGEGSALSEELMVVADDGGGNQNVNVLISASYDIYFKTYDGANQEGTSGYSVWVEVAED